MVLFNDLILLRSRAGIATVVEQLLLHYPQVAGAPPMVRLSELVLAAPLRGYRRGKIAPAFTSREAPKLMTAKIESPISAHFKEYGIGAMRLFARWILDPVYRPELFHEPDMLALPMGRKSIATIPDLSVVLYPQWHPPHRARVYKKYFIETVSRVDRFLAISETSKQDFVRITGIDPQRITVASLAARPQFRPFSSLEVQSSRRSFSDGMPYFLFLSTLEPRKNVMGLIEAWMKTSTTFRAEHRLVLAGAWGWRSETLAERLRESVVCQSVRWIGPVGESALGALVGGAEALVYPSFYEGFGLPPLEAMACGVPVISSDRGALRETLGSAAWIVNPDKPEEITEAVTGIERSRNEWGRKGMDHAAKFSWERFAEGVAELYRQTLAT